MVGYTLMDPTPFEFTPIAPRAPWRASKPTYRAYRAYRAVFLRRATLRLALEHDESRQEGTLSALSAHGFCTGPSAALTTVEKIAGPAVNPKQMRTLPGQPTTRLRKSSALYQGTTLSCAVKTYGFV
jgi:hypothetical protein